MSEIIPITTPPGARPCAACGFSISQKAGSHICGICGRTFCSRCYSLKLKLESDPEDLPDGTHCETCEQLIRIKVANNQSKSSEKANYRRKQQTKVPEKRQNAQKSTKTAPTPNKTSSLAQCNLLISNGEICSDDQILEPYHRVRTKRNKQGFASKAHVGEKEDNRQKLLLGQKREHHNVTRGHVYRPNYFVALNDCSQTQFFSTHHKKEENGSDEEWGQNKEFSKNEYKRSLVGGRLFPSVTQQPKSTESRPRSSPSDDKEDKDFKRPLLPSSFYDRTGRHRQHMGDFYYDDPFIDDENLEELENILAYDEIPYALIIADRVDQKTMVKAMRKQQQREAFDLISGGLTKKSGTSKVNINKNAKQPVEINSRNQPVDSRTNQRQLPTNEDLKDMKEEPNRSSKNVYLKQKVRLETERNDNVISVTVENKKTPTSVDQTEELAQQVRGETRHDTDTRASSQESENRNDNSEHGGYVLASDAAQSFRQISKNYTDKFIREKRLQKLSALQTTNTTDDSAESQLHSSSKVDQRIETNHLEDKSKIVKPKAFRHNIPILKQRNFDKLATSDVENINKTQNDKNFDKFHIGTKNNVTKSKETITHGDTDVNEKIQVDQRAVRPREAYTRAECASLSGDKGVSEKDNRDKDATKNIQVEMQTEPDDENAESFPVAMRLLLKQSSVQRTTRNPDSKKPAETDSDRDPEPIAMRLFRQNERYKESKKRLSERPSKGRLGEALVTLMSTIFGSSPYDDFPEDEDFYFDEEVEPVRYREKKNKNQKLLETTYKKKDTMVKKQQPKEYRNREDVTSFEQQKLCTNNQPKQKDKFFQQHSSDTISDQVITENRHRAFSILTNTKEVGGVKCTGCGRTDCKASKVQQLKKMIDIAQKEGYEVRDVTPDGNCMFAAVVDQLEMYSDQRFGAKSLREAAVSWLIEHPYSQDGTHCSNFLSEDWEKYIQRMMAEGEWGDHVVLRALAEVVGHTVKILHVNRDDSHWTTIRPISATEEGIHLVLGHIGEFHYVSLRPCTMKTNSTSGVVHMRQDSVVGEDIADIPLQGSETVEMFIEDYIDAWSEIPVAHFSFLLKKVLPIEVLNSAAIYTSHYLSAVRQNSEMLGSLGQTFYFENAGNLAEGLFILALYGNLSEDSAVNTWDYGTAHYIQKDMPVFENQKTPNLNGTPVLIDTAGAHSGYTKLRFTTTPAYLPVPQRAVIETDLQRFSNGVSVKGKFVVSLKSEEWPSVAKEWATRKRAENWPTNEMIASIQADGCLITPFHHKESQSPALEFKFCFALAERKLFSECVTKNQKYCYILFETLCRHALRSVDTVGSSHLKSVFFFACERVPAEFWETSPGACILYMFNELQRCIRSKNIPDYFIPTNNTIDHLSEQERKEIQEQITVLRSQPVLYLRQINERLHYLPPDCCILEKISNDFKRFASHKSLRLSTLEVFVPSTIEVANWYIKFFRFVQGFELLSEAFQQRLSVSTCDDSVTFETFLQGAVSDLDLSSLVWFAVYTGQQLKSQLSKPMTRQLCGHMTLTKLNQILPQSVLGTLGEVEVPQGLVGDLYSFCHDFSRFLFVADKVSLILPVLNHCHSTYLESQYAGEPSPDSSFTDDSMFFIYVAMYKVCNRQGKLDSFRPLLSTVETLCNKINKRWSYSCFRDMCYQMYEDEKAEQARVKGSSAPFNQLDSVRCSMYEHWPNYLVVSIYA